MALGNKKISLSAEEVSAIAKTHLDFAEKGFNVISQLRGINNDIQPSLSGGQGDVIRGLIDKQAQIMSQLVAQIEELSVVLKRREKDIESMESNTHKYNAAKEKAANVKIVK